MGHLVARHFLVLIPIGIMFLLTQLGVDDWRLVVPLALLPVPAAIAVAANQRGWRRLARDYVSLAIGMIFVLGPLAWASSFLSQHTLKYGFLVLIAALIAVTLTMDVLGRKRRVSDSPAVDS
jgi:hypothetical protein